MSVILFDTSAYSAFKRGHEGAVDAIRNATRILLPAVVLGEILAGFEAGSHTERNRQELEAFLRSPRVRLVPTTSDSAGRYAHIYAYLRRAGRPVPTNDLWIAASVMEHGAELITTDGHFKHVPQIVARILPA